MDYSMVGPALVLGLGCIGSSIGCGIGGMAAHAVMSRVEENHGTFIGMSAMAASQSIYGFIVMLLMQRCDTGRHLCSDVSDWDWHFCRICSFVLVCLSRHVRSFRHPSVCKTASDHRQVLHRARDHRVVLAFCLRVRPALDLIVQNPYIRINGQEDAH